MKFMVQSEQARQLDDEERAELYKRMGVFYGGIPEGVTLECDYIRADRLGSWSVLDVPDRATLDGILAPFDGYVRVTVTELVSGADGLGEAPPGS